MAVRRSDEENYDDERFIGDPHGFGFGGGDPNVGGIDPLIGLSFDGEVTPGNVIDELDPALVALIGGGRGVSDAITGGIGSGDTGNTERGRDLQPSDMPTTFQQPQAAPEMGLPQGVSVNDQQASTTVEPPRGGAPPPATMDTPAMAREPDPIAAHTPNPAFAQTGTPAATGPRRRSPVQFAESRNPLLHGRAGGLMSGGLGATGTGEASGPIAPTQMMKKLLQLFQIQ